MVRVLRTSWLLATALLGSHAAFAAELPPEPTEAQVRAEYARARDDWLSRHADDHEFDVRHILLASEADAKAVLARIAQGEKFVDLARTLSTHRASAAKGGALGWKLPGYFVEPFAAALEQLIPVGLAREPVRTGAGWHVIQVMGVRDAEFPPYDDVQDETRTALREHWQEYDQSSIWTREIDLRSIVNRGDKTFFQYRERATFGARPERTARAIPAVVDCARKERGDVAPDGSFQLRTVYQGTGQERQLQLACQRAARIASAAQAASGVPTTPDAGLGCDAPTPKHPAFVGTDRRMPGTAVVVRGEVTPAGAIGDVFVDVPSGFPSIDNAAVRAFQAMHCQPRTALQASQWLQRTFLFEPRSTALVDVR